MAKSKQPGAGTGQIRIIGGAWRGRKLSFPSQDSLRPTADRVRETLFNWLAPVIHGARCLDLFSGSGALGLEALSRGAAHCDFVDTSSAALRQIDQHLSTLGAVDRGRTYSGTAARFLQQAGAAYDIVFLDPPFGQDMVGPCCEALDKNDLLAPGAQVYVEAAIGDAPPRVPQNWSVFRDKKAGGVAYRLFVVGEG